MSRGRCGASTHFLFRVRNILLYEEKLHLSKERLTMLEMIVFALVLVTAQVLGGLIMTQIMMKKFMNKEFIKKYTKMGMEAGKELVEEMEDDF